MAASALAISFRGTPAQVGNAAEIGMEHHLGPTQIRSAGWCRFPHRAQRDRLGRPSTRRMWRCGDGNHHVSLDTMARIPRARPALGMIDQVTERPLARQSLKPSNSRVNGFRAAPVLALRAARFFVPSCRTETRPANSQPGSASTQVRTGETGRRARAISPSAELKRASISCEHLARPVAPEGVARVPVRTAAALCQRCAALE